MAETFKTFYVSKATSLFGPVYHVSSTPDDTSRLYTIETSKRSKPHMTVIRHDQSCAGPQYNSQQPSNPSVLQSLYNFARPQGTGYGPNDYVVGTACFHSLSSKIDVTLQDKSQRASQPVIMKRPDPFASGRNFTTASLGQLKWKEEGIFSSNQRLEDQYKRVIARYEKHSSLLSRGPSRIFLVLDDPAFVDANMDVIIVTGFASIEYRRRSDKEWEKAATESSGGFGGV